MLSRTYDCLWVLSPVCLPVSLFIYRIKLLVVSWKIPGEQTCYRQVTARGCQAIPFRRSSGYYLRHLNAHVRLAQQDVRGRRRVRLGHVAVALRVRTFVSSQGQVYRCFDGLLDERNRQHGECVGGAREVMVVSGWV